MFIMQSIIFVLSNFFKCREWACHSVIIATLSRSILSWRVWQILLLKISESSISQSWGDNPKNHLPYLLLMIWQVDVVACIFLELVCLGKPKASGVVIYAVKQVLLLKSKSFIVGVVLSVYNLKKMTNPRTLRLIK